MVNPEFLASSSHIAISEIRIIPNAVRQGEKCFFWENVYNSQHSHCRCLIDLQWGRAGVGAGLLAVGSLVGKATAGRVVPEGSGWRAG